jgi:ATP-dependent RNA helicase DDX46/PRP5
MRDVLAPSNGRITNLKRVTYFVLNEADRMLDMGFEPQIKHMLGQCRTDKQVVMFSATFPRSIESLAKSQLKSPFDIVFCNRG